MKLLTDLNGNKLDNVYEMHELEDQFGVQEILLKYSNLGEWHYPGKEAYRIQKGGDMLYFHDLFLAKNFALDYSQLQVLINLADRLGIKPNYKVFKED